MMFGDLPISVCVCVFVLIIGGVRTEDCGAATQREREVELCIVRVCALWYWTEGSVVRLDLSLVLGWT